MAELRHRKILLHLLPKVLGAESIAARSLCLGERCLGAVRVWGAGCAPLYAANGGLHLLALRHGHAEEWLRLAALRVSPSPGGT